MYNKHSIAKNMYWVFIYFRKKNGDSNMRKEFEEKTEIYYPIKRYEGIRFDGQEGISKNS